MKSLSIDIETYGSVDLTKSGVYAYANAPDFKILLFAYAFDDEEVKIIDLAQGEALPKEVMDALTDGDVLKTAYNANFERTCIGKYFNIDLPVISGGAVRYKRLNSDFRFRFRLWRLRSVWRSKRTNAEKH